MCVCVCVWGGVNEKEMMLNRVKTVEEMRSSSGMRHAINRSQKSRCVYVGTDRQTVIFLRFHHTRQLDNGFNVNSNENVIYDSQHIKEFTPLLPN